MLKTIYGVLFTVASFLDSYGQHSFFELHSYGQKQADLLAQESKTCFFSKIKPYSKKNVMTLISADSSSKKSINKYLSIETRSYHDNKDIGKRHPIWKHFYSYKNDLYYKSSKNHELHLNPIWAFHVGKSTNANNTLFVNTRGVRIEGEIDDKVAFLTTIEETQARLPPYVQEVEDSVGAIPYEGFWKAYNDDAYDFLRAEGFIDFNLSKSISANFGYGKHFIGDGNRSLILSDFSNRYPYLRIETLIGGRFKYTNLFASLIADIESYEGGTIGTTIFPKKYLAFHHLDIALTPNFHLGLFESVLTGKPDSLGGSNFKVEYLNPIIFYRMLEQQDGSNDNIIIGVDFSWKIKKKIKFYGQFVLDELIISELFGNSGWWGSKFGYQLGGKYFDVLPLLNFGVEFNQVRPYTYGHDRPFTTYTNYRQPLAHPLGGNFSEVFLTSDYQWKNLLITVKSIVASYGTDINEEGNVGKNPLSSPALRSNDYGNRQGQGVSTELIALQGCLSYHLFHNFWLDATVFLRREHSTIYKENCKIFSVGFRWNKSFMEYLF